MQASVQCQPGAPRGLLTWTVAGFKMRGSSESFWNKFVPKCPPPWAESGPVLISISQNRANRKRTNDIICKRQSWTSDRRVCWVQGGRGGARPDLSVVVSGEGWVDTQLCWRAAPDNQKPSWAPEKMERKATGERKELFCLCPEMPCLLPKSPNQRQIGLKGALRTGKVIVTC